MNGLLYAWFSAACDVSLAHGNHFFVCTNKVNLLHLKSISYRIVIIAKRFLKLPNFAYANKTRVCHFPETLLLRLQENCANSFLSKGKSVIPAPLLPALSCCHLYLIRENSLLKTFLGTLILMTKVYLYVFSLLGLI